MVTLVMGTPDSGKSLLAETLAVEAAGEGKKYYIATMIPFGEEGLRRIEKHRRMREGKGFITLEWPENIAGRLSDKTFGCNEGEEVESEETDDALIRPNSTVLLECISNLAGNEMHSERNAGASVEEVKRKIISSIVLLKEKCRNLVIVTNVFPGDGDDYDDETRKYVKLVDCVNGELFLLADKVYVHEDGEWICNENH